VRVRVEEKSGFCFGVKRAIQLAEEALDRGENIYCLGEIVHNEKEVSRLKKKGMMFIDHDQLPLLKNKTILIRAHGEPPGTYSIARKNNLRVIDGTCPIVVSLQKKIKTCFEDMDPDSEEIIIYGKKGHPEIIGLQGQINNQGRVIRKKEELGEITDKKKIHLFSQTTMDTSGFQEIAVELESNIGRKANISVDVNNTICNHISHREPGLRKFARENDTIIFVAGLNSSNGRILYEICKDENPDTFFISEVEELKDDWLKNRINIGVCGATSTPEWQLREVAEKIRNFTQN
jgi:4-hydroxy-3-methylbut-2-enyl diphosphate reductase